MFAKGLIYRKEIKYGKIDQMSCAITAYDIRDTHSSHSSFPNQTCGCGSPVLAYYRDNRAMLEDQSLVGFVVLHLCIRHVS